MAYSPVGGNGGEFGADGPQDELGQINLKMNRTVDDVSLFIAAHALVATNMEVFVNMVWNQF